MTELDGLRGWVSLIVVIFHMVHQLFGVQFPELRNPITNALNGSLAVYVFFILSGEALSINYLTTGSRVSVVRLAIKRHSRLAIPVTASVMLVVLCENFGIVYSSAAASIVHSEDWLGKSLLEPISFFDALAFGLVGVFQTPVPNMQTNPFTWTMCIEAIGSVFVFTTLFVIDYVKPRTLFLIIASGLLLLGSESHYFGAFFTGVLFAHWRTLGLFESLRYSPRMLTTTFIIMAISLATEWYAFTHYHKRLEVIAAAMLVAAIYSNRLAVQAFSARISQWLGKISFSLYLVHFPVLVSLTSGLIVLAGLNNTLNLGVALSISAVSIVVSFGLAVCFEPVETLTKWVGNKLVEHAGLDHHADAGYRAIGVTLPAVAGSVDAKRDAEGSQAGQA